MHNILLALSTTALAIFFISVVSAVDHKIVLKDQLHHHATTQRQSPGAGVNAGGGVGVGGVGGASPIAIGDRLSFIYTGAGKFVMDADSSLNFNSMDTVNLSLTLVGPQRVEHTFIPSSPATVESEVYPPHHTCVLLPPPMKKATISSLRSAWEAAQIIAWLSFGLGIATIFSRLSEA